MRLHTRIIVPLLLVLAASTAYAGLQEPVGASGYMDWQTMRVVATGMGVVPAEASPAQARFLGTRAATVDARRNLLEVIRGVRVESSTTMDNFMIQNDTIASQVRGFVQGATVDATHVTPDGVYHTTISMALTGQFGAALARMLGHSAPSRMSNTPSERPASAELPPALLRRITVLEEQVAALAARLDAMQQALEQQGTTMAGMETKMAGQSGRLDALQEQLTAPTRPRKPGQDAPAYTGLVVDARDTGFTPSLRPQLVADDGQIFPSPSIDHTTAATEGHVRYMDSIPAAQRLARVGTLPLTIRATGTQGDNHSALTLTDQDAAILRGMLGEAGNVLDTCRIVIVF